MALCRPNTDFGQGFYVTTSEHQAKQWANTRWVRNPLSGIKALVLRFELDRDWIASLDTLAFARPIQDFWDLVTDCRNGFRPHQRLPPHNPPFDIVYGPVTLWPQILVIQDCDQISFHTSRAAAGQGLRDPWIHAVGFAYLLTLVLQQEVCVSGERPDGTEAFGGRYRVIRPDQPLSPEFRDEYWLRVKDTLRKVFGKGGRCAEEARKKLEKLEQQSQTIFYHAEPLEVAADLAGRRQEPITAEERARYQKEVLGGHDRPPQGHFEAVHPED